EDLREVHAVAFTTRELADDLLLARALEVESSYITARRRFVVADLDHVEAAGDFLPDRVLVVERLARLVDVREFHRGAEAQLARVRFLEAGHHAEQRGLAGAVRSDDADDAAGRQIEVQVVDQQAVAVRLAQTLGFDHEVAEALARRDVDLVRLVAF